MDTNKYPIKITVEYGDFEAQQKNVDFFQDGAQVYYAHSYLISIQDLNEKSAYVMTGYRDGVTANIEGILVWIHTILKIFIPTVMNMPVAKGIAEGVYYFLDYQLRKMFNPNTDQNSNLPSSRGYSNN